MRTRTALIAVLLALAAVTAGCGKSEAQKQADCADAINDTSTVTHRPAACSDLSKDDYSALLMDYGLTKSGVFDDDGNVDLQKLLDDDE